METLFPPTERSSEQTLGDMARLITREDLYVNTLEGLDVAVTMLNAKREIVFANAAFLGLSGLWSRNKLVGKRLGEALGCWRSALSEEGCGASDFCGYCGAARALHCAFRDEQPATHEYRFIHEGTGEARDFRATVRTVEVQRHPFYMLVLRDTTDEKRREMLERVFLHDLANTLSSLSLATQILKKDGHTEHHELISGITGRLVEDVRAQKALAMAERGDLVVEKRDVDIDALLHETQALYAQRATAGQQTIELERKESTTTLVTDGALLARIVGNMVKNALEASPRGATITMGVTVQDDAAEIWVHNPGVIRPEVQAQIFQRSFSTKGRGRGIGSYSMKLLGEKYLGGAVSFSTSAEAGTRFSIFLPPGT